MRNAKIKIKIKKLFISIVTVALAAVMLLQPAFAFDVITDDDTIEPPHDSPEWDYAMSVTPDISFGSTIDVSVSVKGVSGTTSTGGVVVLRKIKGDGTGVIASWNHMDFDSNNFNFYESTSYVPTAGTYRLSFVITAVNNGKEEVVTKNITKVFE